MKKAKLTAALLPLLLVLPNVAQACTQLPPEASFIAENDRNNDQKLSRLEWRKAEIGELFFIAFRLGGRSELTRFDTDKNQKIDAQELAGQVRYRREPCADWNERMTQNSRRQQDRNPAEQGLSENQFRQADEKKPVR